MNIVELLADRMDTARNWTLDLLEDIEEARWFAAPAPGVQHIAWQVGHLGSSQVALIHARCCGKSPDDCLPAGFREKFGRGSKPVPDGTAYPSIESIRGTFDRVHAETLELIRSFDADRLDEPATGEPHPMFKTKGECIATTISHETFHAGQIALTRRIFGKAAIR